MLDVRVNREAVGEIVLTADKRSCFVDFVANYPPERSICEVRIVNGAAGGWSLTGLWLQALERFDIIHAGRQEPHRSPPPVAVAIPAPARSFALRLLTRWRPDAARRAAAQLRSGSLSAAQPRCRAGQRGSSAALCRVRPLRGTAVVEVERPPLRAVLGTAFVCAAARRRQAGQGTTTRDVKTRLVAFTKDNLGLPSRNSAAATSFRQLRVVPCKASISAGRKFQVIAT